MLALAATPSPWTQSGWVRRCCPRPADLGRRSDTRGRQRAQPTILPTRQLLSPIGLPHTDRIVVPTVRQRTTKTTIPAQY